MAFKAVETHAWRRSGDGAGRVRSRPGHVGYNLHLLDPLYHNDIDVCLVIAKSTGKQSDMHEDGTERGRGGWVVVSLTFQLSSLFLSPGDKQASL